MMNNKSPKKSPILSLNNQFSEIELKKVISPKKISYKTPKKYTIKSPKTLQTECQKLKFYNCYKPNNACFYNLRKLQCQHDPKLEEQLKEMLENPKTGLACPPGKYQKNYRGQEYCSLTKGNFDLAKAYKYLTLSMNSSVRYIDSNMIKYSKFYNDLQTKNIIQIIKGHLKINITAFITSLFDNMITLIILFYCHKMNNIDIIDEKNSKLYNFYFFKISQIKYRKLLLSDVILDFFDNTKVYFKDYFLGKKINPYLIANAKEGGLVGGPEEILFRQDLIEFLNSSIKDPIEQLLKKYLKPNEKLEKKIMYIYFIFEILICSVTFGLAHLINLTHNNNIRGVLCQVCFCIVSGFFYHLLKSYNQSLYLIWLTHYYSNFYMTIGRNYKN